MEHAAMTLEDRFSTLREFDTTYKLLKKHLENMPLELPSTVSGEERRLLKIMFTLDEARLALHMNWRYQTADRIFQKAGEALDISREEVDALLSSMAKRGTVYAVNHSGVWKYALQSLIIGMYEMQVSTITAGDYLDHHNDADSMEDMDYFTTAIPRMRFIPVKQSVTPELNIGIYNERPEGRLD